MCGIAGFWGPAGQGEALVRRAQAMADRLTRRGPDDSGAWSDAAAGMAFGHRRLSIIDLSPAGAQPMTSASGRWVVAYNGESYNAAEIAPDLAARGVRFRGHSDTEVLVEALDAWGVEATLPRLVGMFAFAAWDREARELLLVRDRLGIKPLYYGVQDATLLFGSELKALEAHPAFRGEVDREGLTLLLRHSYIPAPHSIYRGIHKLPPGHLVRLRAPDGDPAPECWWSPRAVAERARCDPFDGDADAIVDAVEATAKDAVAARMIADVPLGAFLSGGIDSSTVVSLMCAQSSSPVRTFTIGFEEDAWNEAHWARRIAEHLGTDHTELTVTVGDAEAVIPDLPEFWDEPFADSSQIPTYLVSRLARGSVTVSLSGDGGDELFAGYGRYPAVLEAWGRARRWPPALRRGLAAAARALPGPLVDAAGGLVEPLVGRRPQASWSRSLDARADALSLATLQEMYRRAVSYWVPPEQAVVGGVDPATPLCDAALRAALPDDLEWMMLVDTMTYLPEDILTKVDRASMAVSLEARVPLLDHRLFELAWRLPLDFRMRDGVSKWPLREVLARHVPRELWERPKQGFGVPIGGWLRGSLRDWAEDLLSENRLRREGHLEPAPIRALWRRCLDGETVEYPVWIALMFQAWLAARRGGAAASTGS